MIGGANVSHSPLSLGPESLEVFLNDFEAEGTAMSWMRTLGAQKSLGPRWSMMQLWSTDRCIARVPAQTFERAWHSLRDI